MKKLVLLSFASMSILNLAHAQQARNEAFVSHKMTDTVPRVFYEKYTDRDSIEVLVNGEKFPAEGILTFKEDKIKSFEYPLRVELAADYVPRYISLSDLAKKYTKLNSDYILYKIDDRLIKRDPDEVLVDESNIMSIAVNQVKSNKGRDDIYIITLKPRSEKNMKEVGKIILR